MDFPFYQLTVGQTVIIPKEHIKDARVAVKLYQQRWRKLGWSYEINPRDDGAFDLTRLTDGAGAVPGKFASTNVMPLDYQKKFGTIIEDETIRVFEKMVISDVNFSGMKKEYKGFFVPDSVMRNYCTKLSVFKNHPMGPSNAYLDAIKTSLENGKLKRIHVNGTDGYSKGVV